MRASFVFYAALASALLIGCAAETTPAPESKAIEENIEKNNEKIKDNVEENSQIEEVDTREEVDALLVESWTIREPHTLPNDYQLLGYYIYDKNMVEIRYQNETASELYYRTSTRQGDISGNTKQYTRQSTVSVDGFDDIVLNGSDDQWMVASWSKDSISYSITCENGLSEAELLAMIQSLQ